MKTIQRKTLLYKTGVEYGDYTINHIQGCSHGCLFPCYAFMMAKRFGRVKDYADWCEPRLVENALTLLDEELPRLKSRIKSVHLCFSTDPFMYGYDEIEAVSLKVIDKINDAGIKCVILTKGILPFELVTRSKENFYGITLVSLSEEHRCRMEPYAAPYAERLQALKKLHEAGCKTWVSIEPYPTPNIIEQDIVELLDAVGFVDRIVFGRTHYSKVVSAYPSHKSFYDQQARVVEQYCKEHRIECHIKNGTKAASES